MSYLSFKIDLFGAKVRACQKLTKEDGDLMGICNKKMAELSSLINSGLLTKEIYIGTLHKQIEKDKSVVEFMENHGYLSKVALIKKRISILTEEINS